MALLTASLVLASCGGSRPRSDSRIAVGFVHDWLTGEPVAGARITLVAPDTDATAVTDAAGEWKLELPPPGPGVFLEHEDPRSWWWKVRVEADGYLPAEVAFGDRPVRPARSGPGVFLSRPMATACGRVVFSSGEPAAGVPVELYRSTGQDLVVVETREDGTFGPVGVATGELALHASAPDHPPGVGAAFVAPGQRAEFDVVIPAWGRMTGVVVDADGRAVGGAEVAGEYGTAVTGPDGRFDVRTARFEQRVEDVRKEGYGWNADDLVKEGDEIRLTVRRVARIRGRLLDRDGRPAGPGYEVRSHLRSIVPEVTVTGWACGPRPEDRRRREHVVTDEEGRFSLPGDLGSDVALEVRRDGRLDGSFRVPVGRSEYEVECTLRLPRPVTVEGRVVDSVTGEPVAGAVERWRGCPTDGDGRFAVEVPGSLAPGAQLRLTFLKLGYRPGPVEFEPGKGPSPTVRMVPGVVVGLRVLDRDGIPVHGAVAWENNSQVMVPGLSVWSDREGRISLYLCDERSRSLGLGYGNLDLLDLDVPTAKPGEVVELGDVRIGEPPRLFRVVDERGKPVSNAYAAVWDGAYRMWLADRSGKLSIPSGDMVVVSAPGRESLGFDLAKVAPNEERELVLRPSAPITGRIVGADLDVLELSMLMSASGDWDDISPGGRLTLAAYPDSRGRFSIDGALEGESVIIEVGDVKVEARGGQSGLEIDPDPR